MAVWKSDWRLWPRCHKCGEASMKKDYAALPSQQRNCCSACGEIGPLQEVPLRFVYERKWYDIAPVTVSHVIGIEWRDQVAEVEGGSH